MPVAEDLMINTSASALDLANAIFGSGITVTDASFQGALGVQSGIYSGAAGTLAGITNVDSGVILSTGNVQDFTNGSGSTNTNVNAGTSLDVSGGVDGDAGLNNLAGVSTFDGAILNATFVPDGDMLTMNFVFTSEEYPEYVNSGVNDAFGVWVNGDFVPVTITVAGNVSIDSVNGGVNENLYRDNSADQFNTEMDGFTYVLSIKAPVNPGVANDIRIGIADGGDAIYDSNLLIMGNSVQTYTLAMDDDINILTNSTRTFDILANDQYPDGATPQITQINGQDIVPGQTITLGSGQQVRLNADGTITVFSNGTAGDENFSYTLVDGQGHQDVGFVTLHTLTAPMRDGIVSGTGGDDLIDGSYVGDPDGDRVDHNDGLGVQGTSGNADLIYAGAGDDTVRAGDGDDIVYGGSGDDVLRLDDGHGQDSLDGGATDETAGDTLDAAAVTSDIVLDLSAGDGANPEDGTLTSADGTVTFSEIEAFVLGAGDDQVTGSSGNDVVSTGSGADMVDGGAGNDRFDLGGADGATDIAVLSDGDGADVISGFEVPIAHGDGTFSGRDLLDVGALHDANGALVTTSDVVVSDDGNGNAVLTFPGGESITLTGVSPAVATDPAWLHAIGIPAPDYIVEGTQGDDTIDGDYLGDPEGDRVDAADNQSGTHDDVIDAGSGNDLVFAGQGNDTIFGGAGNDTIWADDQASAGNDSLYGGDGEDLLTGGDGNDKLSGDAGNDTLFGSDGNDMLFGGAGNDTLTGGDGADRMSGGDDRDLFDAVGTGDVVDGDEGGDDFDTLDLSDWGKDRTNIIYDPQNAENGTVEFLDENGTLIGSMTFSNIEMVVPCFTPGSRIATTRGEVAVEELCLGDMVLTRDNGYQPVRWLGERRISSAELAVNPSFLPVRIARGALGEGLPMRDMKVSPQHRMLITSARSEMFFGEREVLVSALHLVGQAGVERMSPNGGVIYLHVMFDQHEVIRADGAWTESFQPGDLTLAGMDDAQRNEILALFPELQAGGSFPAARRSLKAHEARVLLMA